ncbi:DUF6517 family protein [Natrononativus amylolyticus]|uniref:DUF6517 family protein n=1 Tax=Natrononativus amylolyticus TaxID=2963434 RepID=UPI0020CDAE88|nr:DUF6517 family protein [Natrononativus amylolyticus]
MTTRRRILAGGTACALALSAGCLDFALGRNALEFDATRVAPSEAALAETGYEETVAERQTHEETVEAGLERDVRASYWLSVSEKEVELLGETREAATVAAVSMPALEILGSSYNPLAELDSEELLAELQSEFDGGYGDLGDLEYAATIALPVLGADRSVDRFRGTTTFDGEDVDVVLLLTAFDHGDDFVVLLGGYPEPLADEGVNVELLMESVERLP